MHFRHVPGLCGDAGDFPDDQLPVLPNRWTDVSENPFTATISRLLEREYPLPVVLHADKRPAVLFCLLVQRLGERADLGVRQPLALVRRHIRVARRRAARAFPTVRPAPAVAYSSTGRSPMELPNAA